MANRPKLFRIPLFCVLSFAGTVVRDAIGQSDFRKFMIKALLRRFSTVILLGSQGFLFGSVSVGFF